MWACDQLSVESKRSKSKHGMDKNKNNDNEQQSQPQAQQPSHSNNLHGAALSIKLPNQLPSTMDHSTNQHQQQLNQLNHHQHNPSFMNSSKCISNTSLSTSSSSSSTSSSGLGSGLGSVGSDDTCSNDSQGLTTGGGREVSK